MILALLLLGTVVIRDDVSTIPPHHKWRYDRFEITGEHLPVDVDCRFRVEKGEGVRVELMTEENLEFLHERGKYESIESSTDGRLHYEIGVPGKYALVIWNNGEKDPARVALHVELDYSAMRLPGTLPERRKVTVILLSAAGFLTTLGLSAWFLIRAMARSSTSYRTRDEPGPIPPIVDREPD